MLLQKQLMLLATASIGICSMAAAEVVQFMVTDSARRCLGVAAGSKQIEFINNNSTETNKTACTYRNMFGLDTHTGKLTIGNHLVGFDGSGVATVDSFPVSGQFQLRDGTLLTQDDTKTLVLQQGQLRQVVASLSDASSADNSTQLVRAEFRQYMPSPERLRELQSMVTPLTPKHFKIRVDNGNATYRCASVLNRWIGFGAQTPEVDAQFCDKNYAPTTFTFYPDKGQLMLGDYVVGFFPDRRQGLVMTTKRNRFAAQFQLKDATLSLVKLYGKVNGTTPVDSFGNFNGSLMINSAIITASGPQEAPGAPFTDLLFF